MKRVAILGCSHTSYDQVCNEPSNNGHDWVQYLSELAPDYEFHNYGMQGHGPLYFDFVLKYLISDVEKDYYDAIIVQYTVDGRWLLPVNIDKYLSYHDCDNMPSFQSEQITDNYTVIRHPSQRLVFTQHGSHSHGSSHHNDKKILTAHNILSGLYDHSGMVVHYEKMFEKTCVNLYSKYFNNFFMWDFSNHVFNDDTESDRFEYRNNIGKNKPFKDWALEQVGKVKFVTEYLDHSFHCTEFGNKVLVNEYLAPSAIGEYLGIVGKQIPIL